MRRIRMVTVNKEVKVFQTEVTVNKGRKRFGSVGTCVDLGKQGDGGQPG